MLNKLLLGVLIAVTCIFTLALLREHAKYVDASKVADTYITKMLKTSGYVPAPIATPKTPPNTPQGTKPIIHTVTEVRYLPTSSQPPMMLPGGTTCPNTGCDLGLVEADVRCVLDVVTVGGKPYMRSVVSGKLGYLGQVRVLPERVADEREAQIAPAILPPRWGAELLGGVSIADHPGLELGLTARGNGRWGGYYLYDHPTSGPVSHHLGVSFKIH